MRKIINRTDIVHENVTYIYFQTKGKIFRGTRGIKNIGTLSNLSSGLSSTRSEKVWIKKDTIKKIKGLLKT